MLRLLKFKVICLLNFVLALLASCDTFESDVVPKFFNDFELKRDSLFTYSGSFELRLQPLSNDSLKVQANITYGNPVHGQLLTDVDGTKYYKLTNNGYVGLDSISYQVCSGNICKTEKIIIVIEKPLDRDNCTTRLIPYTVETFVNTPVEIRIHRKDVICPNSGTWIQWPPLKGGAMKSYFYAGSPKSTVEVYYPPKDYVGEDSFTYRIYTDRTDTHYEENTVKIIIKPKQ